MKCLLTLSFCSFVIYASDSRHSLQSSKSPLRCKTPMSKMSKSLVNIPSADALDQPTGWNHRARSTSVKVSFVEVNESSLQPCPSESSEPGPLLRSMSMRHSLGLHRVMPQHIAGTESLSSVETESTADDERLRIIQELRSAQTILTERVESLLSKSELASLHDAESLEKLSGIMNTMTRHVGIIGDLAVTIETFPAEELIKNNKSNQKQLEQVSQQQLAMMEQLKQLHKKVDDSVNSLKDEIKHQHATIISAFNLLTNQIQMGKGQPDTITAASKTKSKSSLFSSSSK